MEESGGARRAFLLLPLILIMFLVFLLRLKTAIQKPKGLPETAEMSHVAVALDVATQSSVSSSSFCSCSSFSCSSLFH